MAFLANDAINRVNIHYGVQALAQGAGGVFFLAFLLHAGISVPVILLAAGGIVAGRLALRPAVLPVAKRFGLRPTLIVGTLLLAAEFPLLARVHGVGLPLVVLVCVAALAGAFYWLTYNAYFASIGDAEHRGHQIGAREALVAVVGIVAPLLGAFAIIHLGPGPAFWAIGFVQALAVLPLLGAPNVPVISSAPGAYRAAHGGMLVMALDGWFDACYLVFWQISLFVVLRESFSAYGGAMALAALVGAGAALFLGRHIDTGGGRRAVTIAYAVAALAVAARAGSLSSPWLAVAANAGGAVVFPLLSPTIGAVIYNLAKASPCAFRFHFVTEGAWDVGYLAACLVAAGLVALHTPLAFAILMGVPALGLSSVLLRRFYPAGAAEPLAAG